MKPLWTALYLTIPLVIMGILHMAIVRRHLLKPLARPISEPLFGANKTWRGVIVMPIGTVLGVLVTQRLDPFFGDAVLFHYADSSAVIVGLALGVAYVIAELPNSYMKRRMGIAPGELPPTNRFLFGLLDQADSAIGCAIAVFFLIPVPPSVLAIVILLGPAVHLVVNFGLWSVGLRKRPV